LIGSDLITSRNALFLHVLTNDLSLVQEDLWLSAFPIGTEVCSHPYLLLFCSVYVSGAPLDIAYRLNCALCLAFNNLYNLALSSAVGKY